MELRRTGAEGVCGPRRTLPLLPISCEKLWSSAAMIGVAERRSPSDPTMTAWIGCMDAACGVGATIGDGEPELAVRGEKGE